MPEKNRDDIVRFRRTQNPADAHIIQQALQAAGIDCQVVGDYLDAGIGDIPGVRPEIWVHRNDQARAEEVLRSHGRAAEEASEPIE